MEIPLTIDDREVRNLFNRLPDRATDLIPSMQVIGSFYERPVLETGTAQLEPGRMEPHRPRPGREQTVPLPEPGHPLSQRKRPECRSHFGGPDQPVCSHKPPPGRKGLYPLATMTIQAVAQVLGMGLAYQPKGIR